MVLGSYMLGVQMEISEEMLNFFAHTHKHRQERGIFLLLLHSNPFGHAV